MQFNPAWYVLIFTLGLVFGSFSNVAIHRWPREDRKEREWIFTPSHCPQCNARIRWFDNIPLLSWLILRGRCRDCGGAISIRYPLVELGTAVLWVFTAWLVTHIGLTGLTPSQMTGWHVAFAILFASLYLLTIVIDAATQLIPDEISIAHLVGAWLFVVICYHAQISSGWQASLIGMFVLALFFFIMDWLSLRFLGKPGFGMGDVKLALGLGVLFGWKLVIAVGFIGICLGGLVGVLLMLFLKLTGRYRFGIHIPFGPYLAISAYICLFFGHELVSWYLGLFRMIPPTALNGLL